METGLNKGPGLKLVFFYLLVVLHISFLLAISSEPSIWQHGDCMGCSKDGGVGNMLENSANTRMLSGPASFLVTDEPARYAVV